MTAPVNAFAIISEYDGLSAVLMPSVFFCALFVVVAIFLSPAFIFAAIMKRKVERIRNDRVNTVLTQYKPPRGLKPAEVGLLYDMKCGRNEIVATLFDLEQRQIIRIDDEGRVANIDQNQYQSLVEFERIAIRIGKGEMQTVENPRIAPITYTINNGPSRVLLNIQIPQKRTMSAFTSAVATSLASQGIKTGSYRRTFTLRVIGLTLVLGMIPMVFAGMPVEYNQTVHAPWSIEAVAGAVMITIILGILLFPAYILCSFVTVFLWVKIAGRYWMNSRSARAVWPELAGYKLYLETVDLDNIQFEAETGDSYTTKTMPYAVVFGLDTKWREYLQSRRR